MEANTSRAVENWLAILGAVLAGAYVVGVEIVPPLLYSTGQCDVEPASGGFPWGVVIIVVALVIPKTIGRATAGKAWEAVAGRFK